MAEAERQRQQRQKALGGARWLRRQAAQKARDASGARMARPPARRAADKDTARVIGEARAARERSRVAESEKRTETLRVYASVGESERAIEIERERAKAMDEMTGRRENVAE